MGMIKNATEGIYPLLPYQQALLDKVSEGFKAGEMMIISAGRQTGKSMLNQYYGKLYNNNLCQEIMLTGQKHLRCTLGALNRLPVNKYKFSRANWYVAEYDNKHHFEVLEWCAQQFGPCPKRPDAWSRWVNKYSEKIHFRDAKDYEWFLLRWS